MAFSKTASAIRKASSGKKTRMTDGKGGVGPRRDLLPRAGQTFLSSGSSPQQNSDSVLKYMNDRSDVLRKRTGVLGGNFVTEEMVKSDIGNDDKYHDNFFTGDKTLPQTTGRDYSIDGITVPKPDLGNFFVGVNAHRKKMNPTLLKLGGLAYTSMMRPVEYALGKLTGTTERITGNIGSEVTRDWPIYDAGRKAAAEAGDGPVTNDHIRKYLLPLLVKKK